MSDVDLLDDAFEDWWRDNARYFPATRREEVKLAFVAGMMVQNKLLLDYFQGKEKESKHER